MTMHKKRLLPWEQPESPFPYSEKGSEKGRTQESKVQEPAFPADKKVSRSELVDPHYMPDSDLQLLLDILPRHIHNLLQRHELDELIEIVMDLGRLPEARFAGGLIEELGDDPVTWDDIHHVVNHLGSFTSDNRAGLARTLHRISAMRNRQGDIVGLTCRVGKVVTGTIDCIRDLVESGKSILILGKPGVGKTTRLREISKLLADEARKRVIVVDTSNEIAGDGDIPHPAVGRSRRMQVPSPELQQHVMIEAVENHTPQVIVVDEIGTEAEAMAARTIAERGVILVATAHGSTLENLIKNPVLSDLIGGIQSVTLGDEEAKRRSSQKTVLEREKKPTFDIIIELRDRNTLAVYSDAAEAVDHLLRGWTLFPEVRKVDTQTGALKVLKTDVPMEPPEGEGPDPALRFHSSGIGNSRTLAIPPAGYQETEYKIYLYAITRSFVERILDRLQLSRQVEITENIHEAHAALALKGQTRPGSKFLKTSMDYEVPVFYVKSNTMPQIQRSLREALENLSAGQESPGLSGIWSRLPWERLSDMDFSSDEEPTKPTPSDETSMALLEAMDAIERVLQENVAVELSPRRSYIRRLQHELVEKYSLSSVSIGDEPSRRLRIIPPVNNRKPREETPVEPDDSMLNASELIASEEFEE